jgi:hypothetical protein
MKIGWMVITITLIDLFSPYVKAMEAWIANPGETRIGIAMRAWETLELNEEHRKVCGEIFSVICRKGTTWQLEEALIKKENVSGFVEVVDSYAAVFGLGSNKKIPLEENMVRKAASLYEYGIRPESTQRVIAVSTRGDDSIVRDGESPNGLGYMIRTQSVLIAMACMGATNDQLALMQALGAGQIDPNEEVTIVNPIVGSYPYGWRLPLPLNPSQSEEKLQESHVFVMRPPNPSQLNACLEPTQAEEKLQLSPVFVDRLSVIEPMMQEFIEIVQRISFGCVYRW